MRAVCAPPLMRFPMKSRDLPVLRLFLAAMSMVCVALLGSNAMAAPQGHLLRIDPRAGVKDGSPVLSTLIEIGQFKPISDVLADCSNVRQTDALYDCWGDAVEKPNSLFEPYQFPEASANLLVRVEGSESPAKYVSKVAWKDAQKEPGVGTAWLVALDASAGMGNRFADGRQVVVEFLEQMGPNDLFRLFIFDDRDKAFTADSKWKSFKDRNQVIEKVLNNVQTTVPQTSGSRPLFNTLKNIMIAGFNDLGNIGDTNSIPMHQAFVILSNGAGRQDALTNAGGGEQLKKYATNGRFPEDNTSSPKTPLPIISILFPNATGGLQNGIMANNDVQFMNSLANPEIGGFFSVVRAGQGKARGDRITKAVKSRFNGMTLVKWRLACLNPTVEQTFNLTFRAGKTPILPDGSFKAVPIGVDPAQWPLDINVAQTKAEADANPVFPGGKFKVYGEFCWGGDKQRAEAYFVPAGTKPDPNASSDPAAGKKAMQNLVAQNMRGAAQDANATFVTFDVPKDDKVLEGTGDATVARIVVFDNRANRSSSFDEKNILTLRAKKAPLPLGLILGIVGGVIVIVLLLVIVMRSGGNKKRGGGGGGGGAVAPQPVVAGGYPGAGGGGGGGYGGPPGGGYGAPGGGGGYPGGGGGAPPGGGGYGYAPASPEVPAAHAAPAAAIMASSPPVALGHQGAAAQAAFTPATPAQPAPAAAPVFAGQGIANVRCPSCNMMTMATPGAAGVCFSCGQPLQASASRAMEGGGGDRSPQGFSVDRCGSRRSRRPAQSVRTIASKARVGAGRAPRSRRHDASGRTRSRAMLHCAE